MGGGVAALVHKACGQVHEHAGDLLSHQGEVLGGAGGDAGIAGEAGDGQLLHIAHHLSGQGGVADQGADLAGEHNLSGAAVDGCGTLADLHHTLLQQLPGIGAVGTDGTGEQSALRNDVGSGTGLELTHGEDSGIAGVALPGNQLLQSQVDMDADVDGVDGHLGIGTVRAAALDVNLEAVHGEHNGLAGVVVHKHTHGDLAGAHMVGQSHIGLGILQNAVGQHIHGAGEVLLAGLEHELDGAVQLSLVLLQQLGGGQQHGGMEVMAAAVTLSTGGAGKGQAAELGHGQSIHVCPEQDHLAAGLADGGSDTLAAGLGLNAVLGQLLHNIGGCLGHMHAHFCIGVEVTAVLHNLVLQLQCALIVVHTLPPFVLHFSTVELPITLQSIP